mmetsp:Transcript_18217/g.58916  ORF Transcript_18217/g.58916 Transcript_18217/m.58916 type:complete len:338 (+) Transcript_18217:127-1140(+)
MHASPMARHAPGGRIPSPAVAKSAKRTAASLGGILPLPASTTCTGSAGAARTFLAGKVNAKFSGAGLTRRRSAPGTSRGPVVVRADSSDMRDRYPEESSRIPDSLPVMGVDTDWREFRAKLVAGGTETRWDERLQRAEVGRSGHWAHPINMPEKGCVLLANPLMFRDTQTYFAESVIFLFEHGEGGSGGLILNRPTQYSIGSLSGVEQLLPEFEDSALYLGGDVGKNTVHLIHGHGDLEDAAPIRDGVFMGGFEAAKRSIAEGRASPDDFRWFTRYAGWGPGQLQEECSNGSWFCASTAKDLVLKQCIQLPKPLWREILELMGGDYEEISKRTYGEI